MNSFFNTLIIATCLILCSCSGDSKEDAAASEEAYKSEEGSIIGVNMTDEPKISYCLTRYISDAETRTIWEVLTGEELNYGQLTLRSQPDKRSGMYFFVMFGYAPDEIGLACKIELSVLSTDNPKTRTFTFTIPETHSVIRELRLGLTGSDWPNKKAGVNAWKICVKSPSGKLLSEAQSWLWSVVDKNQNGENVPKQKADIAK